MFNSSRFLFLVTYFDVKSLFVRQMMSRCHVSASDRLNRLFVLATLNNKAIKNSVRTPRVAGEDN